MEPAGASLHGVGVVGELRDRWRPVAAQQRPEPRHAAGLPPSGGHRPYLRLRVDGPDVPAAQAPRQLGYYVVNGTEPDCADDEATCAPVPQNAKTPGIWNPLPYFDTVKQTGSSTTSRRRTSTPPRRPGTRPRSRGWSPRAGQRASAGARQRRAGVRDEPHQRGHARAGLERPRSSSPGTTGAASTTTCPPPKVDPNGYGLRVPALVISPYAKQGYIDHQTLSFDAYLKFIEDDFLGGQRLDPATDGRPDPRPTCARTPRSSATCATTSTSRRHPRSRLILDPHPKFS